LAVSAESHQLAMIYAPGDRAIYPNAQLGVLFFFFMPLLLLLFSVSP
jgi:hypothetical protein